MTCLCLHSLHTLHTFETENNPCHKGEKTDKVFLHLNFFRNCQFNCGYKMSSQTHVQKLSATKQKLSLGEVNKNEKAKAASNKKFARTTVVNPNEFDWPEVSEEDEKDLVACLTSDLQCLKLPNLHIPLKEIKKVEKSKRRQFRHEYQTKRALEIGFDMSAFTKRRADLCLGVNSVSTAMEKEGRDLVGILIDKNVDPPIITKLLVPPARSKGIPIVAISGLNETCRQVFNTRCIALGLKSNCSLADHVFHNLYTLIKSVKEKEKHEAYEESVSNQNAMGTPKSSDFSKIQTNSSGFKPPKIRKVQM